MVDRWVWKPLWGFRTERAAIIFSASEAAVCIELSAGRDCHFAWLMVGSGGPAVRDSGLTAG